MIAAEAPARLLEAADPAISLYMPLDPGQRDLRAHEARLRGMLGTAEARLEAAGLDAGRHAAVLGPARERIGGYDFARHRAPGLALFAAEGIVELVELPEAPPELVAVGRAFHIVPLLPYAARHRRFYILALSAGDVRLFSATPFGRSVVPLELPDPQSRAEADSRLAAERAPGGDEDVERDILLQSQQRLASAVRTALGADTAPVVLVGDPRVTGHFSKVSGIAQLHPETLQVNPFGIAEDELHRQATALLGPALDAERDAVLEQVAARLGTAEPTVAIRLEEILTAGAEGRVDAVIVAEDAPLWGRFHPGETLVAHGSPSAGDEDLLNLAAVLALRGGGRAFTLPADRMPRQAPAVATLRY